jgi:hypothetical protein
MPDFASGKKDLLGTLHIRDSAPADDCILDADARS